MRAVIQVHTPTLIVTASYSAILKKAKKKAGRYPYALEKGICMLKTGSKFGGLDGIKRTRKEIIQPSTNFGQFFDTTFSN